MAEIGNYISDLLFDNDCVIVPSLGGFLASNQPSHIALPNQFIFPPFRHIAFNVYLRQNDGLLANHLAETEKIPYTEANYLIESFTSDCYDKLDNGKKVTIARVGTLFYDKEKNIQFEAFRNFNHLKDSFGMDAVHFLPIRLEEKTEKKISPVEKIQRPSVAPKNKSGRSFDISKRKKIFGIAVIAGTAIWFSLNLYFVAPRHYDATSLNPFDSQKIEISKTDSARNIPASPVIENKNSLADTGTVASAVPAKTTSENETVNNTVKPENKTTTREINPDVSQNNVVRQPVEQKNKISSVTGKHYIVAGVFRVKENAQALLARLQQNGFSNAQIIETNNFNYVAYDSFAGKEEALSITDSIRKKNMEGWIWKH